MYKNVLIIGSARAGKTTLSRMINDKYKYSIINLDDIVSAFEEYPELGIKHDGDEIECAQNFSKFLVRYLNELASGPNFYSGNKFVIEGTHIDFEKVINKIDKEKYLIIGLTYNTITPTDFYNKIKENDTEDDWTYYLKDEELKGDIEYFIKRNKFFNDKFKKYNILTFDTSYDRENILNNIVNNLEDLENGKKNTN